MRYKLFSLSWIAIYLLGAAAAAADEVRVAAAANFAEVLDVLAADFERQSNHELVFSKGSTGQLYAQIHHGAPHHVFLAADSERPQRLEQEGLAVNGSRFTYALGRLVLWSPGGDPDLEQGLEALRQSRPRSLAIANPSLAPYGLAARQTLRNLGLWEALRDRVVLGENIGQVYAMTVTGNAQAGMVALAQLQGSRGRAATNWLVVPTHLHEPIRQQAVLLRAGDGHPGARAFLDYLRSAPARRIIADHGYFLDPE